MAGKPEVPGKDPAEGSEETIDHELQRQAAAEKSRRHKSEATQPAASKPGEARATHSGANRG
jgi:hypothetical protein